MAIGKMMFTQLKAVESEKQESMEKQLKEDGQRLEAILEILKPIMPDLVSEIFSLVSYREEPLEEQLPEKGFLICEFRSEPFRDVSGDEVYLFHSLYLMKDGTLREIYTFLKGQPDDFFPDHKEIVDMETLGSYEACCKFGLINICHTIASNLDQIVSDLSNDTGTVPLWFALCDWGEVS